LKVGLGESILGILVRMRVQEQSTAAWAAIEERDRGTGSSDEDQLLAVQLRLKD
jgi:hypothetical protein